MNRNQKFYICDICGNITEMIQNRGPKLHCCGKVMTELEANTQEAATEKHIPVVNIENDVVKVEVGSVLHPMTEEHYIGWIYLVTNKGIQYKKLEINTNPIVQFKLNEDENIVDVYAYCNLHGLWKASI